LPGQQVIQLQWHEMKDWKKAWLEIKPLKTAIK